MSKQPVTKTILSGIQPSGKLHLGNYLGAIVNWVRLQEQSSEEELKIFSLVDLHALTDKFKVDHGVSFETNIGYDTIELAASLIASGIDPSKSILFAQSHVPEHSELQWILSCTAPMNWLNKMTQFKEKKQKGSSLGLYSYPVLQAADVLLYRANVVPVGEDQRQHLELTRDYALRFNELFCKPGEPFFPLPEVKQTQFPRVMSLKDATKKMSKSDKADFTRINLTDEPDLIAEKIIKAKTDSIEGITYTDNRPEVQNLLRIYAILNNISPQQAANKFNNHKMIDFKEELATSLVKQICPIGEKIDMLMDDKQAVLDVLHEGRDKAREIASKNIFEIKRLIGLTPSL